MNNHKTTAQLKAIAKEQSLGKYGTLIGANLMIFAIQFFISAITTVSTSGSIIFIVINNIITIIVNILLGLLMSGKAYLYMNLIYSQPVSTSDIFFGLKMQPQKAVIIQAFFVVIDFLTSLPGQLFFLQYQRTNSVNMLLCTIFITLLGLLINLIVYLNYSQTFFLLHDFPDRSAKELLATSRRIMRGNKFRLFYMIVSYIPLYILGCVTMFLPLLWVAVYRYASTCAFYQDLISCAANKNTSDI